MFAILITKCRCTRTIEIPYMVSPLDVPLVDFENVDFKDLFGVEPIPPFEVRSFVFCGTKNDRLIYIEA